MARMAGEVARTYQGTAAREGTFVGTRDWADVFTYGIEKGDNLAYLFTNSASKAKHVFGSVIDGDNIFMENAHIGYWTDHETRYTTISGEMEKRNPERYFYEELEETLIMGDLGIQTTMSVLEDLRKKVKEQHIKEPVECKQLLIDSIREQMDLGENAYEFENRKSVVLVIGVNGVGKTTTIGKLAAQLVRAGKKVYIGAADTFRAAAIDQLQVWADRAGATMIKQEMGADPASVAFDTLKSAVANGADVVLIDTAGRLHNKVGLMNELTKIRNVMAKVIPDAPHEVMLVLDGSTGQNAFEQARQFTDATQVTSLAVTKLDGTAKGGVIIGISDQFRIPVRYIGIGEGIDQLKIFDRQEFVNALFGE